MHDNDGHRNQLAEILCREKACVYAQMIRNKRGNGERGIWWAVWKRDHRGTGAQGPVTGPGVGLMGVVSSPIRLAVPNKNHRAPWFERP